MRPGLDRPAGVVDREREWQSLTRFAGSDTPGATLGFVSGRRRQGKALLLQALCEATGGFYYEALQAEPAESLRHLGAALARYRQEPGRLALDDWDEALEALEVLLAEPSVEARNPAAYHSVLGALVAGRTRHGEIAAYLGHRHSDLAPVLEVLEEAGFVARDDDVVRRRRPSYRVAEPFLRFHYAVVRPQSARLRLPDGPRQVWRDQQETYSAQVLGPTLEEIARAWVRRFAPAERLGGGIGDVGRAVVNDRSGRVSHEVDVVATGPPGQGRQELRLLGEVKVGQRLGGTVLRKLARVRELLADRFDTSTTRLALFSTAGFESGLPADALLVDLDQLYRS